MNDINKILNAVNKVSKINIKDKVRDNHHVWTRWIFFKIVFDQTGYGPSKIARTLNKNHATIIHGLKNVKYILKEKKYKDLYENILIELKIKQPKLDIVSDKLIDIDNDLFEKELLNIIVNKIKHFNKKDLEYFLNYRVEPFIKTHK